VAAAGGGVVACGIGACDGTQAHDDTRAHTHALPVGSGDGVAGPCTAFQNRLRCRGTDWLTGWV